MIGQRVVREALERGHHVTLVARDPAKVTESHERLTIAKGDVLDSAGIAKIAANQDVVISAVGTARAQQPDYSLYLEAADSLITALRSLGDAAPRLIVVGGVGNLKERTGSYRVGEEQVLVNDKGESAISMEDYAVALIDEAENPRHTSRRFTVGY